MQRAAFPELQSRPRPSRHRRQDKPDRVLIGLKIATFLAACGLVGVIILLTVGGSQRPHPVAAQPKAPTGQTGDDAPRTTPTPTEHPPVVAPPALRTEVAEITKTQTTPKAPKPAPPAQPGNPGPQNLPVVGQPCPEPGMWSVTANYEPVFCYGNSPPRWRKVF
jgi:hypothetical protein